MGGASVTEAVLAAEERRRQALLANDIAALEGLLSDRLRFMHANAVADDKATLLGKLAKGGVVYRSLTVEEAEVTPLGEAAAALTSRLVAEAVVAGVEKRLVNRTLSVWALEDGVWRMVAYQPTPVPG